jgi:hypothetical protein
MAARLIRQQQNFPKKMCGAFDVDKRTKIIQEIFLVEF